MSENEFTKLCTVPSAYALEKLLAELQNHNIEYKIANAAPPAQPNFGKIHVQPSMGVIEVKVKTSDIEKAKEILKGISNQTH